MPIVRQQFFLFQIRLWDSFRGVRKGRLGQSYKEAYSNALVLIITLLDSTSTLKKEKALLVPSKHNKSPAVIHKGLLSLTHSLTKLTRAGANKSLTYELEAYRHTSDTWHVVYLR